jgi:hypothetical protein
LFSLSVTGTYSVRILLGNTTIPGSPYNMTVFAGPPSPAQCLMQVCDDFDLRSSQLRISDTRSLQCDMPFQERSRLTYIA